MIKYDIHGHMGKTSSGDSNDAKSLIEDMDKYGISKIGISDLSGVVNRVQNDLVYDAHLQYPDRIYAYAFINPKAPNVHEEIDLCLGERKMAGVKFHAWKHGYYSDNTPQIDDVLTHIEKYGVHVQTHVGTSPLSTPFAWIRYAQKHPNLRFLFTHMGCREFAYSVIEAVKDIPNIYLETSVIYDVDVLKKAKECVGAKRIVFGTDWPYKSVECEIEKIYHMGFTEEELEYVFHKNAEELWKIKKENNNMNINVFRIDDRLIHGQIVTKWIKDADAKMIMVVDDKVTSDKTQQMILKFAVPSGISLEILNKQDAVTRINEDKTNTNVLLLVRNPKEANALVELGLNINRIIIGNISNSKSEVGRTKLLDYIYVEPQDVEAIKSLHEKFIEVKAIPEEKAKDPMELISKKFA